MEDYELENKNIFEHVLQREASEKNLPTLNMMNRSGRAINFIEERIEYINTASFTFLSKQWISHLAKYMEGKRVLELMSGTGALAKCLMDEGVDIKATDNMSWHESKPECIRFNWEENMWCTVEKIDNVNAIRKYGNDVDLILISWIPYNEDDICKDIINAIREVNPDINIVLIGEDEGGCCASDIFFENIVDITDTSENTFHLHEARRNYRSWYCIHDGISLVKIKK